MTGARAAMAPLLVLLSSCARACSSSAAPADAAPDAADAAAQSALAPPRCTEAEGAQRIAPDDLPVEIGAAAQAGANVDVGVVRGGVAALAIVAQDLGSSRVIDLGSADPAAPPPVPCADGAEVFVAWARRGDAGRRVAIARVGERADVGWDVPIAAGDEDVEIDLALHEGEGLLAWTSGDGVHVVALAKGGALGATHDFGRAGSDTGSPRLEVRSGGYWLAWTAVRPDGDASVEAIEGAGDRSATGWIELAQLDPSGAPRREPTTITPRNGHAFGFDWRATDASLDVLARDDESGPVTGGRIALVRIAGEKAEPSRAVVDGVGRGAPTVLGSWLVYSDPLEHARVLPLDVPGARPSVEAPFADARPIWAGARGPGQGARVLAVRVGERGRGAEVRALVCVESR